jgi:hypothetical protein
MRKQPRGANSFVDLRIVGADAERAGRMLDMSWNPFYLFDQPPTNVELRDKLNKLVTEQKLDARFEVISPRIPIDNGLTLPSSRAKVPEKFSFTASGL